MGKENGMNGASRGQNIVLIFLASVVYYIYSLSFQAANVWEMLPLHSLHKSRKNDH